MAVQRPAEATSSALAPAKDVAPAASITWWHAMSGVNGDAINKIVAGFNSSQSKIKVETVFQGNYDDLLAKLNTAIASNAAPALVQVYDIGQRYMYDSQQVVPMQAFIDRDKFATTDFEPAVINYYKYQDKLQSMPFNASTPILYYNKDAFQEVGLDPNKPPVTFTEIADAAKKLTKKDASGDHDPLGLRPVDLRLALRAAPGDVRLSSTPTTATAVTTAPRRSSTTTPQGKAILDWWKAGVDGGYFFNPGIDNDGAANAFNAQKTAMYIESTARLRGHITTIAGKFDIGTGLYPRPDSKPNDGRQHHRRRVALHHEEPAAGRAAGRMGVREVRDDPGRAGPVAGGHGLLPDREGRLRHGPEQGMGDQVPAVPDGDHGDP